MKKGNERSKKALTKGDPVYYCKVSKYNPEINFSKIIISRDIFEKLKRKQ